MQFKNLTPELIAILDNIPSEKLFKIIRADSEDRLLELEVPLGSRVYEVTKEGISSVFNVARFNIRNVAFTPEMISCFNKEPSQGFASRIYFSSLPKAYKFCKNHAVCMGASGFWIEASTDIKEESSITDWGGNL